MSCCQYSPFSAPTPYESAFIVVRERKASYTFACLISGKFLEIFDATARIRLRNTLHKAKIEQFAAHSRPTGEQTRQSASKTSKNSPVCRPQINKAQSISLQKCPGAGREGTGARDWLWKLLLTPHEQRFLFSARIAPCAARFAPYAEAPASALRAAMRPKTQHSAMLPVPWYMAPQMEPNSPAEYRFGMGSP